jgi:teichuronic acid biosynthesis glycosyltransferase TuaC
MSDKLGRGGKVMAVTQQLRVLSVIPGMPDGSSMIFARRQSAALAEAGHEVKDFHLADRTSLPRWASELRRLRREVANFRPDIIHAHYGTVTAVSCVLARGRRPLVITYRGSDLNPTSAVPPWRSAAGRLMSRLAAAFAAEVICVSDRLRQELWWRRRSAHVIPSGVDTELFQPLDQAQARRELGIGLDQHVVAFNCGFDPWRKRLDLAEAVMQFVRKEMGDVEFVVMRGDWDPARVPLLLSAADCLLVTSRGEGSPNIVKEAIACDLPIVSVDVGDVVQRIAGLRHCHIGDDRDDVLGRLVVAVLRVGERSDGRSRAEQFGSQKIAADITAVYQKAVAARR